MATGDFAKLLEAWGASLVREMGHAITESMAKSIRQNDEALRRRETVWPSTEPRKEKS